MFRTLTLAVAAVLATTGAARADVFWTNGGNLNFTDAKDAQGKHFHVHLIHLEAGKHYVFDMTSVNFDTFLRLKNPAGIVVVQNDDGGPGLNSRIAFRPLVSGMYRLIATSYSPGATGYYKVTASRFASPGGFVLNVHGDLNFSDPLQHGKHKKVHRVFLHAGREYVINMSSTNFDTFLKVTNDWGFVILQNDDGGPGRNSRIVFRPMNSRFYNIVATSFAPGATGEYHLTIRD
jgi:hypothetical protein